MYSILTYISWQVKAVLLFVEKLDDAHLSHYFGLNTHLW